MTAPTLAEVLEAAANAYARPGATTRELNDAAHWQTIARARALELILTNRTWLERCELERAARAYFEVGQDVPVRVLSTSDFPDLVTIHYEGGECRMVIVGALWKPEVGL